MLTAEDFKNEVRQTFLKVKITHDSIIYNNSS